MPHLIWSLTRSLPSYSRHEDKVFAAVRRLVITRSTIIVVFSNDDGDPSGSTIQIFARDSGDILFAKSDDGFGDALLGEERVIHSKNVAPHKSHLIVQNIGGKNSFRIAFNASKLKLVQVVGNEILVVKAESAHHGEEDSAYAIAVNLADDNPEESFRILPKIRPNASFAQQVLAIVNSHSLAFLDEKGVAKLAKFPRFISRGPQSF